MPRYLFLEYNTTPELRSSTNPNPLTTQPLIGRQFTPPRDYAANAINVNLQAGDTIEVYIRFRNKRANVFDGAGAPWGANNGYFIDSVDGTWTTGYDGEIVLNIDAASSSFFKNNVKNVQLNDGNSLLMQDAIPKDIKKRDFFKGLVNAFHLYVEPNKNNPKELIIEPRDDYYTGEVVDWQEKWNKAQEVTIEPMGALEAREYDYTYKADKDFYNTDYTEYWDRIYANREFEIDNDFETNTKTVEIPFSPTPSVGFADSNRIIPFIIKKDNQGQVAPIESNIRLLFYTGLKDCNVPWNHTSLGTDDFQTQYPYVGMWDDPYSPTEDLGFGLTRRIYWDNTWGTITETDSNLVNKYHKKSILEITDPNSKIVKAWFALTPFDVNQLDFRKFYRWDNSNFILNKVLNYKEDQITQCEFLKLNFTDDFTPDTKPVVGGKGESFGDEVSPIFYAEKQIDDNSYDAKQGNIIGDDNYVARTAENFKIVGDDNSIGDFTKNVTILNGSGNKISSGITDVTLINTNDVNVTEGGSTYIDGIALSGPDVIEHVSANFKTVQKTTNYVVDSSGGNIAATIDSDRHSDGKILEFKKTSGKNKLTLNPGKGYTIDGLETIRVKTKYSNFTLKLDKENLNWIIL